MGSSVRSPVDPPGGNRPRRARARVWGASAGPGRESGARSGCAGHGAAARGRARAGPGRESGARSGCAGHGARTRSGARRARSAHAIRGAQAAELDMRPSGNPSGPPHAAPLRRPGHDHRAMGAMVLWTGTVVHGRTSSSGDGGPTPGANRGPTATADPRRARQLTSQATGCIEVCGVPAVTPSIRGP